MQNSEHFDRLLPDPIDQSVRRLDQFANVGAFKFRDHAPRFWKPANLIKSVLDSLHRLLGIHRRRYADELRDRREVLDCLLRPAEPELHDARRILARTRASAAS